MELLNYEVKCLLINMFAIRVSLYEFLLMKVEFLILMSFHICSKLIPSFLNGLLVLFS